MTSAGWIPGESEDPKPRGGVFYGWWLAAIGAVILVIGTAPLVHALSLWSVVLSQNFGWTPLQLSWAFTLLRIQGWVLAPIAGWGVGKIGPRKMTVIGMVTVTAGWVLFSRIGNLWMFYASFALISVGAELGCWIPVASTLVNWFRRRLCTAMALPTLGLVLAGVVIVPMMAWFMSWDAQSGTAIPGRLGWRNTALLIGLAGLAVAVTAALLMRDHPEDYGQHVDGTAPDDAQSFPEYTLREAIKTRALWMLILGAAFAEAASMIAAQVASMPLPGQDTLSARTYYPIANSVASVVFVLVGGLVGDRIPIRHALALFAAIQLLGVAMLLAGPIFPLFLLAAALTGIQAGAGAVLSVAVIAIYFGRNRFAWILGITGAISSIGSFTAVALGSALAGSQTWSVLIAVILAAIGVVAYRAVGPPKLAPSQRESTANALGAG